MFKITRKRVIIRSGAGFVSDLITTPPVKCFLMIHIVRDRRVPPFYKVHGPCNMGVGVITPETVGTITPLTPNK